MAGYTRKHKAEMRTERLPTKSLKDQGTKGPEEKTKSRKLEDQHSAVFSKPLDYEARMKEDGDKNLFATELKHIVKGTIQGSIVKIISYEIRLREKSDNIQL